MLTRFTIEVSFRDRWRPSRYVVIIHSFDSCTEQYKIHGRNGFILIESNRPLFANRVLRHRRPDFKLVQGELSEPFYLGKITDAIWNHFVEERKRK